MARLAFPTKYIFTPTYLGGPLHLVKFNNQGMFVLLIQTYVRAQLL